MIHELFMSPHIGLAFQASLEAPPNKTKIKSLGLFKNWAFQMGILKNVFHKVQKTTKKT